jgi:DNA repair protein RecN (Recombination protein N)
MINSIQIKNFALIDEIEIFLDRGLNILAGETGAGKSIIIDAIDAALGARTSKDFIKSGEKKAFVELTIKLDANFPYEILAENEIELEDDKILIISREISANGSKSRINGVIVTQNYINNLRKYLLDIHSQHETYTYINPKTHLSLLDGYGGEKQKKFLSEFKSLYNNYNSLKKQLSSIKASIHEKTQRIDFLNYQIEEIASAKIIRADEYTQLKEQRELLVNADELKTSSYSGYEIIYRKENSVIDLLSGIEKKLERLSVYDKNLGEVAATISSAKLDLKDVAETLMDYSENIDADPFKLEQTEERINVLEKLQRKYGPELSDVILNLKNFKTELEEISFSDEQIAELEKSLNNAEKDVLKSANALSIQRKALSEKLSALIQKEIVKLEMPNAKFSINVEQNSDITPNGLDSAEFFISTNPGEELKPLAKVASGGEVSRIMLGMKTVFAKSDKVNTVIFDEIDTGISGKTSQAVAEELVNLSVSHQILCITHQPIIAVMADKYLFVEKVQSEDLTKIGIKELNQKEITEAIAKLASGSENNEESLKFAKKLIDKAVEYKETLSASAG